MLPALLLLGTILSGCGVVGELPKGYLSEGGYTFVITDETAKLCSLAGLEESVCPENVVIPDTVSGYTVTAIRPAVFFNHTEIKSVTFPTGLLTVQDNAFYGCTGLTELVFPEGLNVIGWNAFMACTSLTSVSIPSTLKTLERKAFSGCEALETVRIADLAAWCSVRFEMADDAYESNPLTYAGVLLINGERAVSMTIPEGVSVISAGAFCGLSTVENVTLPETLTEIGACAFYDCRSLKTVEFPAALAGIGSSAFEKCSALTSASFKGISAGQRTIGKRAFTGCTSLREFRIPSDVDAIDAYTFADCIALACIEVSENTSRIGACVLLNCTALTDIYYPGTQKEWQKIDKVSYKPSSVDVDRNWDYNAGKYTLHYETTAPIG